MDPLEIDNIAALPEYKFKVDELDSLLGVGYTITNDAATMNPKNFLPLEYDYKKRNQKTDNQQPGYILKKYFKDTDIQ